MEQLYRDNEGSDQLSLFPEERQPSRFWKYLPYLTVGAVVLMLAGSAFAQETVPMLLTKAALCDTEDGIKTTIDAFSSADQADAEPPMVEGCGFLQSPAPALVTPIGEYENQHIVVLLATIEIPGLPLQYGYLAWRPKPPGREA